MRKESDKFCFLVMMGVRSRGEKILAIEDGFRESTETWKEILRNLKERGLTDTLLLIENGSLGFWAAVRKICPAIREQRCRVHKTLNVLNYLPSLSSPGPRLDPGDLERRDIKKRRRRFRAL